MAKLNNLAYDYSIYENLPQKEPEKRIQVKKNPSRLEPASIMKSLCIAAAALFLLSAIIYGKLEISKLYAQSSKLDQQINVIVNENAKYQTDIESKTSVKAVEEYAEKTLGLQKLDRTQIEYIELQKDNIIEVVDQKDKNIFVSIKDWFKGVLEYIGA